MKNLKRIFSLALAGTMLAGMLTVGASAADFTDADSIKNSEAVDTMVALNIINGKDDGSFAPEATVTPVSYTHLRSPRDRVISRMPSSA